MPVRLLVILLAAVALSAAEWTVSPAGDDAAAGSRDHPFRTIGRALRALRGGDTLLLREGVYRERLALSAMHSGTPGQPTVIAAWPGERAEIRAWDVVEGWVDAGSGRWVHRPWTHDSQQALVDGTGLERIGPPPPPLRGEAGDGSWRLRGRGAGPDDLVPGSFHCDGAALWIRLRDDGDPRVRLVEASVRDRTVAAIDADHVVLRDLACRGGNLTAAVEQGSTVEVGSHCLVERCDVRAGDFGGIHLGWRGRGSRIVDCVVSGNGACGINAPAHEGFAIAGCTVDGNNTRGFNPAWHAGGIKIVPRAWGTIERCRLTGNRGSGIWIDSCRSGRPLRVVENVLVGNGDGSGILQAAIFVEVSRAVVVAGNRLRGSRGRGILVSGSDDVTVEGNAVLDTLGAVAIEAGGLPRVGGATLTGVRIVGNVIAGSADADLAMLLPDGEAVAGNISDGNQLLRVGGVPRLRLQQRPATVAAWHAAGFDRSSRFADPADGRPPPPATDLPQPDR